MKRLVQFAVCLSVLSLLPCFGIGASADPPPLADPDRTPVVPEPPPLAEQYALAELAIPAATSPITGPPAFSVIDQLNDQCNQARARYGLPAVSRDAGLDAICQAWADHLGRVCATRWGIHHGGGEDIITTDIAGHLDPAFAMYAWMRSSGHRETILTNGANVAGWGLSYARNGDPIWVGAVRAGGVVTLQNCPGGLCTVPINAMMPPPIAVAPVVPVVPPPSFSVQSTTASYSSFSATSGMVGVRRVGPVRRVLGAIRGGAGCAGSVQSAGCSGGMGFRLRGGCQ